MQRTQNMYAKQMYYICSCTHLSVSTPENSSLFLLVLHPSLLRCLELTVSAAELPPSPPLGVFLFSAYLKCWFNPHGMLYKAMCSPTTSECVVPCACLWILDLYCMCIRVFVPLNVTVCLSMWAALLTYLHKTATWVCMSKIVPNAANIYVRRWVALPKNSYKTASTKQSRPHYSLT